MRILVVEDEPKMAGLLCRGFERAGRRRGRRRPPGRALWPGPRLDYDVVLLDVMLPGIDGFEACRRLRARGSGRRC